MPPKRKPTRRSKKAPATPKRSRSRRQPHAIELPLRQGLLEMATIGAHSFLWVVLAAATVAAVAGSAFAVWSQRPVPAYSSEGVEVGSPFDVTFRIENTSPWFALGHLNISCALTYAGAPDSPPTKASDVRLPAGNSSGLGPGESATFK